MEIDEDLFYSVPLVIAVTEGPTDIPYLKLPLNAHFKEKYGYQCKTISLGGDVTSDMYLNDDFFNIPRKIH